MQILRKYQLDIIFLFFSFITIISLFFYIIDNLGIDPHRFEWLLAGPFLLIYTAYNWEVRSKINISQMRELTGKTLAYWIVLGITLFSVFKNTSVKEYYSLNSFYIIFTLFLADSYWDFKKLTIKSIIARG